MALGQPDLGSGAANQGQPTSATGLGSPAALAAMPGGGLLVADKANNRVVFFDSVPGAVSGPAAHAAIGQLNLLASSAELTQTRMNGPYGVAVGAGRMAVADSEANRVLVYTELPVAGMPMPAPAIVIGQPDFTSALSGCAGNRLAFPTAVAITPAGKLIVVDTGNHRVLVWNRVPVTDPVPLPDRVLGQGSLDRCVRNNNDLNGDVPARGTFSLPQDAWSDDERLVIADAGNNRVMIWRHFPTAHLQDADVVLGHSGFTTGAPNDGAPLPSAGRLHDPEGVHSDGTALAVADSLNNRVLIWRTFPSNNGQDADVVLGHADFATSATNDGNNDGAPDVPTAQVFNYPLRVLLTPDSLFVSDHVHHRVLRFAR